MVPIDEIKPREDQPRQYFDEEALSELAQSIRENGFIGAVTVRCVDGRYDLLAGHRRRLAAIRAGLTELPCVVVDVDDAEAEVYVLLDNLNRQDLLPWEEGEGYQRLVSEYGLAVGDVARRAGKSSEYIRRRMMVAEKTGEAARQGYLRGELSLGTVEALCELPDAETAAAE